SASQERHVESKGPGRDEAVGPSCECPGARLGIAFGDRSARGAKTCQRFARFFRRPSLVLYFLGKCLALPMKVGVAREVDDAVGAQGVGVSGGEVEEALGEVCRANGTWLVVNASQALGAAVRRVVARGRRARGRV